MMWLHFMKRLLSSPSDLGYKPLLPHCRSWTVQISFKQTVWLFFFSHFPFPPCFSLMLGALFYTSVWLIVLLLRAAVLKYNGSKWQLQDLPSFSRAGDWAALLPGGSGAKRGRPGLLHSPLHLGWHPSLPAVENVHPKERDSQRSGQGLQGKILHRQRWFPLPLYSGLSQGQASGSAWPLPREGKAQEGGWVLPAPGLGQTPDSWWQQAKPRWLLPQWLRRGLSRQWHENMPTLIALTAWSEVGIHYHRVPGVVHYWQGEPSRCQIQEGPKDFGLWKDCSGQRGLWRKFEWKQRPRQGSRKVHLQVLSQVQAPREGFRHVVRVWIPHGGL